MRIDRVARQVGLSKGSFFHHFATAGEYRAALLDAWRERAMAGVQGASAVSDLAAMAQRVGDVLDMRLERSVRAWATHDAAAATTLAEVDSPRLAALQSAWADRVTDSDRARAAALLPHLVVIGATVAHPDISDEDLAAVFGLLAELIPAVSTA